MEIGFCTNNYVNILGSEAPNEVKEAWNKAEKECGINGYGYGVNSGGKLTCLTSLFAMSLVSAYNGGGRDILGNTVYSAKAAVQKALDSLGIPQDSKEKKEKFFYESFLRFLN